MNKGHEHTSGEEDHGHKPGSTSGSRTRNVIVFGLICGEGHEFEGWFRSNQDFDDQSSASAVACPACHSTQVHKGIMAPNLNLSGSRSDSRPDQPECPPERPYGDATDLTLSDAPDNSETIAALEAEISDMRRQIKDELRTYVETNFDYVGHDFPEEARRRHYDAPTASAGAYGEASVEDMVALIDEGIKVAPLPQDPKKLN